MKWEKTILSNIVTFRTGKLNSNAAVANGDYPFFTCSKEIYRTNTSAFNTEAVLLGGNNAVGDYPLFYFNGEFDAYQRTYIIEPINNDKLFIRYLYYDLRLKLKDFQSYSTGASTKFLTLKILNSVEVNLPSVPIQHKIASILSAYDDLIENNLKRIKLLEEQAFLKYKGIVSSEKLKAVQLKDVAVVNESTLKANSNIDKLLYVDIASVSTGSIDNKTEYNLKEAPGRAKRILKHEDIIWSCVRPNRKSYAFVWQPENNLIASTGFAVITSKAIPATFLYQLTTANEFVSYLENHAKGATYPAVTATDFAEALINIPTDSIMQEYHEAVSPCYELKSILQKQNTKLREARDILLPKLMNGQIEV